MFGLLDQDFYPFLVQRKSDSVQNKRNYRGHQSSSPETQRRTQRPAERDRLPDRQVDKSRERERLPDRARDKGREKEKPAVAQRASKG